MNHQTIEEHQITERYLQGRLLPAEEAGFEEHYLACPECLDRLALAESMARGFKRAAGQEVARQAATRQLLLVAWLSRLGRSRQALVLAMALFAVVLLPAVLTFREMGQRQEERQRWAQSESEREAETARLTGELAASRAEAAREREAHTLAEQRLATAREPQGNVPILFLDVERGPGEPSQRVRLPASPGWVVLSLTIDPPHQPSYRVLLHQARGQEVWRGTDLHLMAEGSLSLSLPSTLLAAGDYDLAVEGLGQSGKAVPAGRFTFRVLPPGK